MQSILGEGLNIDISGWPKIWALIKEVSSFNVYDELNEIKCYERS